MISICIPIYNYYAYPLVRRLVNQIEQYGAQEQVEVIEADISAPKAPGGPGTIKDLVL